MRDRNDSGLQNAIDAAGGVGALARGLGIAQPSVSGWTRVPSDRVLAIEALTGVSRSMLRPDLYPDDLDAALATDDDRDMARARGQEYLLLANLLARPPSAKLLADIAQIQSDPSPLGLMHGRLAAAARATTAIAVGEEYFKLFVGVGRGELLPYGSFYLTGFLHERPLARVREDLARAGVERNAAVFEPEDHIATLLETIGGLCRGDLPGTGADERHLFERHLKPWAPRFFADLCVAEHASFYRSVGELGAFWIELESVAFELPD
jgi:TorA maturation chaperone TorD